MDLRNIVECKESSLSVPIVDKHVRYGVNQEMEDITNLVGEVAFVPEILAGGQGSALLHGS